MNDDGEREPDNIVRFPVPPGRAVPPRAKARRPRGGVSHTQALVAPVAASQGRDGALDDQAARAAERARIQNIMALPEAQRIPEMAAHLALATGDPVPVVQAALRLRLRLAALQAAERERIYGIMALPEAQRIPEVAAHLAFATNDPVPVVQVALRLRLRLAAFAQDEPPVR